VPGTAAGVIGTGMMASALAFWAWNTTVAALGRVAASRHVMLMTVYGAALAWPALGEPLGLDEALGGAWVDSVQCRCAPRAAGYASSNAAPSEVFGRLLRPRRLAWALPIIDIALR
jgi:hypothetical protein